jgi:RNase H-fold protein (predicted Holliday junction resolvase)
MCPVPKAFTETDHHYEIGFAVSDPYLAHANPIDLSTLDCKFELHVSRSRSQGESSKHSHAVWSSLPPSAETLLEEIGYRDIGAVALAFPMKPTPSMSGYGGFGDEPLSTARDAMRRILSTYDKERQFELVCCIQERLTIQEAQEMAENEPAMWEDIELKDDSPTIHACVALNSFLWKHIGGWPNTFG